MPDDPGVAYVGSGMSFWSGMTLMMRIGMGADVTAMASQLGGRMSQYTYF
jgi:hypothetical protein